MTDTALNFEKIWQLFKETDRKFQETDKKMRALQNLFEGQWGKLMESLVEGDLARLLREHKIWIRAAAMGRTTSSISLPTMARRSSSWK